MNITKVAKLPEVLQNWNCLWVNWGIFYTYGADKKMLFFCTSNIDLWQFFRPLSFLVNSGSTKNPDQLPIRCLLLEHVATLFLDT